MTPQQLARAVHRNRYTQASYRTLSHHASSGRFNETAALRLLRRNVRDVHPDATHELQQRTATVLLTAWRKRANTESHATQTE